MKTKIQNNENMNNVINFSSVYGEETVAQTAVVDKQVVNDLYEAFKKTPSSVVIKFQNSKGILYMSVQMTYSEGNKCVYSYQTYADCKLIEKMLCVMHDSRNTECLKEYNTEEHKLKAYESDPRIELFRQFMQSKYRCVFERDYKPNAEESYVCATFIVGNRKQIKFCLKRTEEIEAIINEAIQAA